MRVLLANEEVLRMSVASGEAYDPQYDSWGRACSVEAYDGKVVAYGEFFLPQTLKDSCAVRVPAQNHISPLRTNT